MDYEDNASVDKHSLECRHNRANASFTYQIDAKCEISLQLSE
jgi:hypothetical protein